MIIFIVLLILLFVLFLKSGEKTVKKALESDRIFLPFDDSIHQTPPQQDRIKRAVEQNLKVKTLLSNGYSGSCDAQKLYVSGFQASSETLQTYVLFGRSNNAL